MRWLLFVPIYLHHFSGRYPIKYIEVKTTTGDINSSFNVTDNELEFSKLNAQNYYLYRIFDYDKVTNTGKFYFIQGDISNALVLRAQNYVVQGLL